MNLCVYDTVKHVQVRDARLAVLRYFFLLTIGIYVCVFELWAYGGWLDSSPVVGVVRFSLQQPTVNGCNPQEALSSNNCTNDFRRLDELPYCAQFYVGKNHTKKNYQNDEGDEYPGNVYNCRIYESINAQIISEKSLAVITRGSTSEQSLVCTDDMMTCPRTYHSNTSEDKQDRFYTTQPESFTILLDHAVTASKLCTRQQEIGYACSSESSKYHGRLYSKSRELCMEYKEQAFAHYIGDARSNMAPCYIQPNQTSDTGQDFLSLDVLLRASGIQLDDCNNNYTDVVMEEEERTAQQPLCQTFRETGATILLNVYWNDFVPYFGKVEPYYFYSPVFIGGTFKQYIPYYHRYRESRTLLNAHGIKIAVLLGGEFNQFHIITFLTTVTTALGLLAVANTIVDNLMLYVLPEKDLYIRAKYETTELFHTAGTAVTGSITGSIGLQQQQRHGRDVPINGDNGDALHEPPAGAAVPADEESKEQNDLREPLLRQG